MLNGFLKVARKSLQSANMAQAHAVTIESLYIRLDNLPKETEQSVDLILRAIPVFRREGVHAQHRHMLIGGTFHHAAHGFYSGFMAERARQMSSGGPTPIAIHDDSNVARSHQPLG